MVEVESKERDRLRWASRVGRICGLAASPAELLDELLVLSHAAGGFVGLNGGGGVRTVIQGLQDGRLLRASGRHHEPIDLAAAAQHRPVKLLAATVAAAHLGGAHHDGPALRIATDDATLILWFDAQNTSQARLQTVLFGAVHEAVLEALGRFAVGPVPAGDAPLQVAALGAWSRCNVPLLFLNPDGDVVAANPAAWRKLELSEDTAELPPWLRSQVLTRLAGLQQTGGLPDGASGDYAWVVAGGGHAAARRPGAGDGR